MQQLREELAERSDWTIKKSALKIKSTHVELSEHDKIV